MRIFLPATVLSITLLCQVWETSGKKWLVETQDHHKDHKVTKDGHKEQKMARYGSKKPKMAKDGHKKPDMTKDGHKKPKKTKEDLKKPKTTKKGHKEPKKNYIEEDVVYDEEDGANNEAGNRIGN